MQDVPRHQLRTINKELNLNTGSRLTLEFSEQQACFLLFKEGAVGAADRGRQSIKQFP